MVEGGRFWRGNALELGFEKVEGKERGKIEMVLLLIY